MAKQDYKSGSQNRNLPGVEPENRMPFTNAPKNEELSKKTDEVLGNIDKTIGGYDPAKALELLADEDLVSNNNEANQTVQRFHEKNLNLSSGGPSSSKAKPNIDKNKGMLSGAGNTSSKPPTSPSLKGDSEAKSLSDTIDKYNQDWVKDIGSRIDKAEGQKVGKLNIRGRARKRVKLFILGAVFAVVAAVPIGILGVIPHAMQSWVQNKVSAYTERAVDKMGQKVLYSFIKNRVAIDSCKKAYNAAGNTAGIGACRARVDERDTRLSQLFNDWHSAKMEDKLVERGINVEYNYAERSNGRPYKITIDRPESEGGNFQASGEFGVPDLDSAEFIGKREASIALRQEMKTLLREDTRWWQYLKRRNLKAGYLRDLGLPSRVFPSKKVAKTLDDIDAVKLKGVSEFRQYLTKFVVNNGDARVGALLEILLSGDASKGEPGEIIKNNKAFRAAAEKLGAEEVVKLLEKFAGKNLQEIQVQIIKDLILKFSEALAEKFGELATKSIPVIGWILLAFTILDMLDLATDGTLQQWISGTNAQSMMDVSNMMDTTVSEEKRGYVDLQSAGDMRLSLINGLGSSRVFANMVGYQSIDGKQPSGYSCKPDVSIKDPSSFSGAIEEIFNQGDPTNLKQVGMADDQQTCENHRVDYDPINALGPLFSFVQGGFGPYEGLSTYTGGCVGTLIASQGSTSGESIPFCPTLQEVYHGAQGGFSWILETVGITKIFEFIGKLPPIKAMMENVTGWMSNGVAILITGQSLAGPELLQGGLKTDSKSGARLVDGWVGGGEVQQFAFAKGVGDGGGLGGVPLTPEQAARMDDAIASERKEELAASSFFDRMFDISNSDTLISGVVGTAIMEGGMDNFVNPMKNVAMALSGGSTYAEGGKDTCSYRNDKGQAVTEFGIVCYAIPDEYIDGLTDEQLQDLSDPDRCDVQTSALDTKRREAENGTDRSKKDPDGTGTSTEIDGCRLMCTVTDTMGTNFRVDDKICGFENLGDTSSQTTSSGEAPTGEISEDSFDTPCYKSDEGYTVDLGERDDAYSKGKRLRIRLCALPDMPCDNTECNEIGGGKALVSSVFSEGWSKLIKEAKADGIPMAAVSSWRTMAHQQELCSGNAKCSAGDHSAVAEPGYSNHQAGAAIDLDNSSFGGAASGRTCETAQTANTNTYEWMRKNAKRFGIGQYANEAWHWGGVESCRF